MPINVLLADDQASHLDLHKVSWKKALGASIRVEIAHELISVEQKLSERPHIIIIDNQFDLNLNEGANFIAKYKKKYPDIVFVLMTGQGFDIDQLGQRIPNADFLVPKSYLLIDTYLNYIGKAILSRLNRSPIMVSTPTVGLHEVKISRHAFTSLVEQCVHSLEVLDFSVQPEPTAEFEMMSGGYSGAVVYQMRLRGAGRSPDLPLVIKCGSRDQIQREIRAFEGWVRWQLPHDMRVDIIGRGVTGDHSAICYGFVLGSADKLVTMRDAIISKNCDSVFDAFNRIIFAKRTGWYGPVRSGSIGLCQFILNRYEYTPDKDEKRSNRFNLTMGKISADEKFKYSVTGGEIIFDGVLFGSIRRTLAGVPDIPVNLVYCHGDLNANNIFMDASFGGLALIDFEQAGENHIFRDIISFETSIRMDMPVLETSKLSFMEMVEEEVDINSNTSHNSNSEYFNWIVRIRKMAEIKFPFANKVEYIIPLVLHSWKVLGIQPWSPEVDRRLCATILGGLKALRNLK